MKEAALFWGSLFCKKTFASSGIFWVEPKTELWNILFHNFAQRTSSKVSL